jgi:hypothetical protein
MSRSDECERLGYAGCALERRSVSFVCRDARVLMIEGRYFVCVSRAHPIRMPKDAFLACGIVRALGGVK